MFSLLHLPFSSVLNVVSYYPQSLSAPLYYLSKLSPVVTTTRFIAKTQNIPYLQYLPKTETTTKVGIAYEIAHEIISETLKHNTALSAVLTHRATSASLSAIGTTAAMLSCGAPAILIAGGSILSAASTWNQHRRSAVLESKERFLDENIMLIMQNYPYITNAVDTSVTTDKNKSRHIQDSTTFSALDYSKVLLDMSIAAGSSFIGQTNLVLAPAMLASEYRRINRITQKEEQYQALLANLSPEEQEKVKKMAQKLQYPSKQVERSTPDIKTNKRYKTEQDR